MACMDKFKIKVNYKGSHGAQPHMSVDPVVYISTYNNRFTGNYSKRVKRSRQCNNFRLYGSRRNRI